MESGLGDAAIVIGRIIFGGCFLISAVLNYGNIGMHAEVAKRYNIGYPRLMVIASITFLTIIDVLITLGIWTSISAIGMIMFLAVITPLYHDFWRHTGGERVRKLHHTLENGAIIGALMIIAAVYWP